MQALKVLVIAMGVAIVVIIGVIVATLIQRAGGPGKAAGPGEIELAVPAGCRLAEAGAAEGRLILRLDGPAEAGCRQAVVLDLESGDLLGRVTLVPETTKP